MKSFKNRILDSSKKVDVYRCLNRKGFVFSIRQSGFVVAHAENVTIENVNFIINLAGKKRVIKEQQKNVHAFLRGYISNLDTTLTTILKYNPYNDLGFNDGININLTNCKKVTINNNSIKYGL